MVKIIIVVIIGVVVLTRLIYTLFEKRNSGHSTDLSSNEDEMFIATQSGSNQRIKDLGLDQPSEDASSILNPKRLLLPTKNTDEPNDYQADPSREWVIELIPTDGQIFHKADFSKIFDYEWRTQFSSTLYGYAIEEKEWTYANAGDSPNEYNKLQIGIDVQRVYAEESQDYSPIQLERYRTELEKRLQHYPTPVRLETKESIAVAIQKARRLIDVYNQFNKDAIIILQSAKRFKGIEAWDALQCTGLNWGDMDIFHWNNYESKYGHDQHFSVWTSTDPGFFFPEEIKNGNMNPENLIFGFSIPRSAYPINVYKIMLEAAQYCQNKLGGKLLNEHSQPLNEHLEQQELLQLIEALKKEGIPPGSGKALRMF